MGSNSLGSSLRRQLYEPSRPARSLVGNWGCCWLERGGEGKPRAHAGREPAHAGAE